MKREYIMTEMPFDDLKAFIRESVQEAFSNLTNVPTQSVEENLISRKEIASDLKISLVTLNDWMKKGLPFIRMRGRIYFSRKDVLDFLKKSKRVEKK